MAVEKVGNCNVHSTSSIWVYRITTQLHLRQAAFGLKFLCLGLEEDDIERAATVLLLRGVLLLKLEVSVTADQACCFLD
jgi:hypothetical protein